eukprot:4977835-Pyramimonas_sp.AAC.1
MEPPGSQMPFWFVLVPSVGTITIAMRNEPGDAIANACANRQIVREDGRMPVVTSRRDAHNIAAQVLLEHFAPPGAATSLEGDVIHEMLPGLTELIDIMCDEHCQNVPAHQRWSRVLLAVRE